VYVGSPAERSFVIGRKGSKIKKLARYLGIKIVVNLSGRKEGEEKIKEQARE